MTWIPQKLHQERISKQHFLRIIPRRPRVTALFHFHHHYFTQLYDINHGTNSTHYFPITSQYRPTPNADPSGTGLIAFSRPDPDPDDATKHRGRTRVGRNFYLLHHGGFISHSCLRAGSWCLIISSTWIKHLALAFRRVTIRLGVYELCHWWDRGELCRIIAGLWVKSRRNSGKSRRKCHTLHYCVQHSFSFQFPFPSMIIVHIWI